MDKSTFEYSLIEYIFKHDHDVLQGKSVKTLVYSFHSLYQKSVIHKIN